jgi:hypothetical protein
MKDYPVFHSHDAVECFNCGRSLDPKTVTESNFANGSGGFKAYCRDCDLITFYDLSAALPAYRRRARELAAAAVLATMIFTGCGPKPIRRPPEAAAPTAAELSRTRSQRSVIHTLQHNCLAISAAQTRYVASLVANHDEYHAQSYLFAIASTDAHAAHCAQQTVTACEGMYPGECIAPGEKGADRP